VGSILSLILGIDAAWTKTGSSGVALLEYTSGRCHFIACAPSYESFIAYSYGKQIDWRKPSASALDVSKLIDAATRLGRGSIEVLAIDMPVASKRISSRRLADQEISIKFGSAWAATHSPSVGRPGAYGHSIAKQSKLAGFQLVTKQVSPAERSLIEVYPLAALVRLLNVQRRPLYKVSKCSREWPKLSRDERILKLLEAWRTILKCLKSRIAHLDFPMPRARAINTLSALKPYEDALDAIISAYVGALFLSGSAEAYGDDEAAIWVPKIAAARLELNNSYLTATQTTLTEWDSPLDEQSFRTL
jgi:predicted RNase H-like nuclease